jgi:hypothetical protein
MLQLLRRNFAVLVVCNAIRAGAALRVRRVASESVVSRARRVLHKAVFRSARGAKMAVSVAQVLDVPKAAVAFLKPTWIVVLATDAGPGRSARKVAAAFLKQM